MAPLPTTISRRPVGAITAVLVEVMTMALSDGRLTQVAPSVPLVVPVAPPNGGQEEGVEGPLDFPLEKLLVGDLASNSMFSVWPY